jgi:class 3 adenylate cyclase
MGFMATALRTYLFTDILGYRDILRTNGDAAAARLVGNYRRIVAAHLEKARGATIQELVADTVFATFRSPAEAVRTAVAIVQAIDAHNGRRPAIPVQIGIGIHAGEAVRQGRDYVGSSVALASRLSQAGRSEQILITDTVHALVRSADVPPMIDLGVWGPHDIGQTVHVYEVVVPGRTASPSANQPHRRLLAVLFTDIAKSTDRAVEAGDRRWGEVVVRHHAAVREQLRRHHGVEVDTAGDGFFATFDSPSGALECAVGIREDLRSIGIEVRQGLHVGECELIAGKVGGIAVVVGARTRGAADPGEILATQTVRDLTVGGSFDFRARGTRVLKGIPGRWHLYGVEARP